MASKSAGGEVELICILASAKTEKALLSYQGVALNFQVSP
jgi:hypothetical protein